MRSINMAPLAMAALLLASPALAARPLPEISAFTVGKTTVADVIKANGKPNGETTNSDGTESIIYSRTSAHAKAATFVPVVGMFAGGAKGTTEVVTFVFNSDGTLKSANKTTSNIDCGMAFAGSSCH
jgi:hypothetical protein